MLKTLMAAGLVLAASAVAQAAVEAGECVVELDGDTWHDGPCQYEIGSGGSFEFHALQASAFVHIRDGVGFGAVIGRDEVLVEVGYLAPEGACWTNARAKICVWRPGTR